MGRRVSLRAVAAGIGVALAASLLASSASVAEPSDPASRWAGSVIDPALLDSLGAQDAVRFVVEFAARADLDRAPTIQDSTARGEFVVDALRGTADASQRDALELARRRRAPAQGFWLRNEIVVDDLEWGVARIGADQVWPLGVTGTGVVIASIDTGVDHTHPALVNQYRGSQGDGTFDHDYNWWDPAGVCGPAPCDNVGHGTHTMGTLVGGDGLGPSAPDIGVAPGAQWIAAKGCETTNCSESSLLSSGQFVLAPTDLAGDNPDPARRPHIVNNSWGGNPGNPFYLDTVRAWRAAGIVPVFSSGNPGSACGAGGSPGDYEESISAGATDINDVIADFSGRGISVFGKINPDVTAPGVNVTSSVPGGGYAAFSGTSMAAPHLAGTFALMLSAAPELIGRIDEAGTALRSTAFDIVDLTCGGEDDGDPNNVYGDGRIDALAAVNLVATGGTLVGTVTDAVTGEPIAGTRVTAGRGGREFATTADGLGHFEFLLAAGSYTVRASAFGDHDATPIDVEIVADQTTTLDVALAAQPTFTVSGRVRGGELGAPLARATIEAIGIPVEPVPTNRRGRYSLTLPAGTYTLRATVGGCTHPATAEVVVGADVTQDFVLTHKIDDFGHGCRPIDVDWTVVGRPTGLFGDDVYTELRLPFAFPFYDEEYSSVWVTSNGFLSFEDPLVAWSTPSAIPSAGLPNRAIFPLWTDLVVDSESGVDQGVTGIRPNRAFVVEYDNVREYGVGGRVGVQVKLWEDGRIDMLYRNNQGRPGDGRTATIGIEDTAGGDAFQFSFAEALLNRRDAFRYEVMPSGVVSGVVTNDNDGEPVAGATVSADPGGRTTVTDTDGSYSLRLVPGRYDVTAVADEHVTGSAPLRLATGQSRRADFALRAGQAEVTPAAVSASTELGVPTTETVTVANTGSAPLSFELRERDFGGTPPDLPPAVAADGALEPIIDDPDDDAEGGPVEITGVLGGSDGRTDLSIGIDFSADTPFDQVGGYVYFDTDQDAATGVNPQNFFGLPTQRLGLEYVADLWGVPIGTVIVLDAATRHIVAEADAVVEGQRLSFDVPLAALGGDDGAVDVGVVVGDDVRPTDWAPDIGKGTIEPDRDAPWMSADPTSGTLEPGASTEVAVTLGGDGVDAGTYAGRLEFLTNDPRQGVHVAEVGLDVTLPTGFGGLEGAVTNGRDGSTVAAEVVVHAQRDGVPYDVTATASVDGTYLVFAPAGTWPAEVSFEVYETVIEDVTIEAGSTATHDVALPPLWPNATVEGGPLEFELAPGETATAVLALGNLGGLTDLTFEISEQTRGGAREAGAERWEPRAPPQPSNRSPDGSVMVEPARHVELGAALVLMDALPWGTDSIQEALVANGVAYDLSHSADMATIDLSPYEAVFIGNDQPPGFYAAYTEQLARFEAYVEAGGFLWLGGAGWGANGGSPDGVPLPGGGTINGPVFEEANTIVAPDHPLVAGIPNPITLEYASHSVFSGYPAGSEIAVGDSSGQTTLAEYDLGAGRVVIVGQTVEFGWAFGLDLGLISPAACPMPWRSTRPTTCPG